MKPIEPKRRNRRQAAGYNGGWVAPVIEQILNDLAQAGVGLHLALKELPTAPDVQLVWRLEHGIVDRNHQSFANSGSGESFREATPFGASY